MACLYPNIAVAYGSRDEGYRLKFIKSNPDRSLKEIRELHCHDKLLFLPCGHCINCAADYARAWQGRIMCEFTSRKERGDDKAVFLTLTYNDNYLVEKPLKAHLRKFIKDVRNKYGQNIKFFGCGELGSLTGRAHYHLILFGVDFSDKEIVSKRGLFYCYRSKEADALWHRGFVTVGQLDIASAGYVSKYCDKKKISGLDSGEFVIMSRGLGKEYFIKHKKEIFDSDYLYFEGNKFKMPRIFLRWALNDKDFFIRICAEDYANRKELVAASFRYDNCRSVRLEEYGLQEERDIAEFKASKEVLRNVFD